MSDDAPDDSGRDDALLDPAARLDRAIGGVSEGALAGVGVLAAAGVGAAVGAFVTVALVVILAALGGVHLARPSDLIALSVAAYGGGGLGALVAVRRYGRALAGARGARLALLVLLFVACASGGTTLSPIPHPELAGAVAALGAATLGGLALLRRA